jgi:hypothetical protein
MMKLSKSVLHVASLSDPPLRLLLGRDATVSIVAAQAPVYVTQ